MAALSWSAAFAQPSQDEQLTGVWQAQQSFASAWNHELTIRQSGSEVVAAIDDITLKAKFNGKELRFKLPGDRGAFRGRRDDDGNLAGHWIQPATQNTTYPYAFPLHFTRDGKEWSARVRTLPDRITLFLKVSRADDGPLQAFIRNPEWNLGIRLGNREVKRSSSQVRLLRGGADPITGKLSNDGKVLTLTLPSHDQPFQFRRTDRASAFYPAPTTEPYRYRVPEQLKDGWATVAPDMVDMNPSVLEEMVQSIRESQTEGLRSPYIHSILVARSGKLVLEEYFHGYDRDTPHDTRSAGKSVGSMIVGSVLDRNPQLTTETTIAEVFGNAFTEPASARSDVPFEQRQQWRRQITIGQALGMQSGLDLDDNDDASLGREDTMQDTPAVRDWAAFVRAIPMHRKPGSQTLYSSNSINLAVTAVAHVEKEWLPNLLRRHITEPLGIDTYYCNLDPAGNGYYGGGIRLRPRDQLKLGQVMLAGGVWKGQRVLSESWVKQSTTPTGSMHEPNDYCMGWWRRSLPFRGRQVDVFHASGNGGQFIIGVPEFDMVVQISGGNYRDFRVWYRHLTEMVPKHVFAAMTDAEAN